MYIEFFFFIDRLAITKIDVLDDFDEIKVAVDYKMNGEIIPSFPGMFLRILKPYWVFQKAVLLFELPLRNKQKG